MGLIKRSHIMLIVAAAVVAGALYPLMRELSFMVIGLVMLVIGADWLIGGSASIARRLGINSFVVGLTVVAFGTSAPELAASVRAAFADEGGLAVGNVVGSNIANICLILGLTAAFRPVPAQSRVVKVDVPIMIGVTVLAMWFFANGIISRFEGAVLFLGILVYTIGLYKTGKADEFLEAAQEADDAVQGGIVTELLGVVLGIAALAVGASLLVDNAVAVATAIGVSSTVIGLTMVAFGTSVPELITSLTAAFKRESDIAVGNILGSNVFNILSVLGISALVMPLDVPHSVITREMWVMLIVALACVPIFWRGKISRVEGVVLTVFYVGYMIFLFLAR